MRWPGRVDVVVGRRCAAGLVAGFVAAGFLCAGGVVLRVRCVVVCALDGMGEVMRAKPSKQISDDKTRRRSFMARLYQKPDRQGGLLKSASRSIPPPLLTRRRRDAMVPALVFGVRKIVP